MDHEHIERLRDQHPAWKLLAARNAPLALTFLGEHFVTKNQGATPASALAAKLDDLLYALNDGHDEPRYPQAPLGYLDDWAEAGWLRRFYPTRTQDEVHYDALPAVERAFAWVEDLKARSFVGTESRLHTVVELLRQIVQGTEPNAENRLADLHRRRAEIDREIAAAEAGELPMLESSALRDRYQQFASVARSLLSDFRQVEENFRDLDSRARERIATWEGGKGELLMELVGGRDDISGSDQGRSFQAFYDFLLSEERQEELSALLARVQEIADLQPDDRLRSVHYDWAEAAERTQRTVRQISEQLRRFLDDQVWLENRRVVDLARRIESAAVALRDEKAFPQGIAVDGPGLPVVLPFERPLYQPRSRVQVDSLLDPEAAGEVDVSALFGQTFIDQARLAGNVRAVVPARSSVHLEDILGLFPLEHGVAELVGYLALGDDDIDIDMDESETTDVEVDDGLVTKRVRLPRVTVSRR